MPGKQVKNWGVYEALRRKGYTKEKAARVANSRPPFEKKRPQKKEGR